MLPSRRLLLVALAATIVGSAAARGADPTWYGGIELGSKGIKLVALPIDDQGRPGLGRSTTLVDNVTLGGPLKDGGFSEDVLEDAHDSVKKFYDQLTRTGEGDRPAIPPERIWIVASSGLVASKANNMDALKDAVRRASGGHKELQSISTRREVELEIRARSPETSGATRSWWTSATATPSSG